MREDLEYVGLDAGTEGTAAAGRVVGIGLAPASQLLTRSALGVTVEPQLVATLRPSARTLREWELPRMAQLTKRRP